MKGGCVPCLEITSHHQPRTEGTHRSLAMAAPGQGGGHEPAAPDDLVKMEAGDGMVWHVRGQDERQVGRVF